MPLEPLVCLTPLGPREQDVLTQLAMGRSSREIARVLSISENTVKAHCNRLFARFEVPDRLVLVCRFWANGAGWYEGSRWKPHPLLVVIPSEKEK